MAACHGVRQPGALPFANCVTCTCQSVWASSVKGLTGLSPNSETVSGRHSMWDLAQSGYSIEVLFFPASLSKLSAVCLRFWVTEMFFHSPPPSFLPGSLSSPSIFLISSTVHFTGLAIFLW